MGVGKISNIFGVFEIPDFFGLNSRCWAFGPSINGLVTYGNTKLCFRAFILALFHSTTANKVDSEHIPDYKKLLPVCEVEILQVTVKKIKYSHL